MIFSIYRAREHENENLINTKGEGLVERIAKGLAAIIERGREKYGDNNEAVFEYVLDSDTPYVSHENYMYVRRAIFKGYTVIGEAHKHSTEDLYESRWKEIVENEDGSINMEALQAELADYLVLLENVPKVYDELAGFSKPHTDPQVIIDAVHGQFIDREIAFADLKMLGEWNGEGVIMFTEKELKDYLLGGN